MAKAGSSPPAENSDRIAREQAYHDEYFAGGSREPTQKFYHVFGASTDYYEGHLSHRSGPGKKALELGCGDARWSHVFFLAQRGTQVEAIDVSPVAIDLVRAEAERRGLTNVTARVMDAEELEFPDGHFDLICGNAILHHLDLDRALGELARVLKPDGLAIFSEPLGHNPALNLYRRRTPQMRTVDEHPLLMKDLALARRYFAQVDMKAFYLLALCGVPFRNTRWFPALRRGLNSLDRTLFRAVPFFRRYAWISIISLLKPRKIPR